jgi:serine/threonine-protein kinase
MPIMTEAPTTVPPTNRVAAPDSSPLAEIGCCRAIPALDGQFDPSVAPQVIPAGQILDDRFEIREMLASSGMAIIYRAEDLANARAEVAIKVPLRNVETDPVGFERFRREEEFGLRLSHPFLLRFFPIEGQKCRPYLAMELLRGCPLDRLAADARPLPEADALKIVGLIAEAAGAMHQQGLIHRDLKPANVMLTRDRSLRLMDFGLASPPLRHRSLLAKLIPIFGTPEYMAPEQVDNGPIDERTDIYALGAILYELLTGQVPFRHDDPWQSAFQRTTGDPIAPRKLNPAISPQAEEIVLHALQRHAEDRYLSMEAFKADLDAPERVTVTGYCERLRPPRFKLSFQATPMLAGALLGVGVLLGLVGMFVFLAAHGGGK